MTVAGQIYEALTKIKAETNDASLREAQLIAKTLEEAYALIPAGERAKMRVRPPVPEDLDQHDFGGL